MRLRTVLPHCKSTILSTTMHKNSETKTWQNRNLAAMCRSAPQALTHAPSYSNPTIVALECNALGPGQLSLCSDPLMAGRSRVRIPVMVRFFVTVQPGPGAT